MNFIRDLSVYTSISIGHIKKKRLMVTFCTTAIRESDLSGLHLCTTLQLKE